MTRSVHVQQERNLLSRLVTDGTHKFTNDLSSVSMRRAQWDQTTARRWHAHCTAGKAATAGLPAPLPVPPKPRKAYAAQTPNPPIDACSIPVRAQSAVKERETRQVERARALAARPASGLTAGAAAAMLGLLPSRAAVLPCSRIHTEYILRQRAGDQAAACCRLLERAADTGAAPTQLALHALQDACRRAARARRLVAAAPSRGTI